ncbi:MAG TPA: sigma-54 dependent transcriptional regulator [Bryobacteraceae bacterium]|nr:sigma-54 dependent transcriptional regulator [Bryobacteraceae bacterium]
MTNNGRTILLGEDELEVRSYLEMALRCHGYSIEAAQDGEEVLACLERERERISLVLLDIMMPRKDGLETLRDIRRTDHELPVVMLSGASSPLKVVEAMKSGATDFIPKPVNHDDLCEAIEKALGSSGGLNMHPARLANERAELRPEEACTSAVRVKAIEPLLNQIGSAEVPVLIQGETGVGKEVIARQLCAQSPRADRVFLKLNCAALPSELVESELFGYERGAFTGAFQKKPGMFEMADGGTILLDEIGDMDFKLQAKLLQVLQDQEFQRLGGKETVKVDVRVIAATHCDLEKAIVDGRFREDLYYRLNVMTIRVPPLRERKEEIVPLAEFLLKKHARPGTAPLPITPALHQAMVAHQWPGNIRELENVMRKYLVVRDAEMIIEDLRARVLRRSAPGLAPQPVKAAAASAGFDEPAEEPAATPILKQVNRAKEQAETDAILAALNSTRWNRKQAAQILNIDYKALLYKMKKLSIEN